MSFACFNISVTVFKGKTSDVVILEQIPDPFRPFSHALAVTIFVFDHANHTRKKMKSS